MTHLITRRALALALTLALLALTFGVASFMLHGSLVWPTGRSFTWIELLCAAGAGALLPLIATRVERMLAPHVESPADRALRLVRAGALDARGCAALGEVLIEHVPVAFGASGVALYAREPDGNFRRVASRGGFAGSRAEAELENTREGGIAMKLADTSGVLGAVVVAAREDGATYGRRERAALEGLREALRTGLAHAIRHDHEAALSAALEAQTIELRAERDRLEDERRFMKHAGGRVEESAIAGRSAVARALSEDLARLADKRGPLLLLGERGSGKGRFARALHARSEATGAFLRVDCGGLAGTSVMIELFGHERELGRPRRGALELAEGGTLLLERIECLPLEGQRQLRDALESGQVRRAGGAKPVSLSARVVASSHVDLAERAQRGEFDEALHRLLSSDEIEVAPLRERREDLRALCERLMPVVAARTHQPVRAVGESALARLSEHDFPGNIHELETLLERAIVVAKHDEIGADDLTLAPSAARVSAAPLEPDVSDHATEMERIERERIEAVMLEAGGNKSHAARALGIPRTTLISKLKKHGLAAGK